MNIQNHQESTSEADIKARQQRVVSDALAPFEDRLMAQLPSMEQMLERAAERQRKSKLRIKGTAFAILTSAIITAFWLDPAYMTYTETTAMGKQTNLQLSDGSEIQLNTNTKVTVAMHLRSRKITLHQGEATFHVAHSLWHQYVPRAERPFIVQAGDIQIRDIGTIFNVRLIPENHTLKSQTHVTVLKGRVLVSEMNNKKNPNHIELSAGESIYSQNSILQQITAVDAEQITAWRQGRIYFYNQTLSEVLHELNRYGELPITIKNDKTAQIRISAQVDINQRERFIALLPSFAAINIHQEKDGKQILTAK